jgi:tRNA(adenine34) deaminase
MPIERRRLACLSGWIVLFGRSPAALAQAGPAPSGLAAALARARELRDEAVRSGDQAYGAVVIDAEGRIVGEGPSRVVTRRDFDAHAEREALRDAARRLGREDLTGLVLVSTSRPCSRCEEAAAKARIARMFHGEGTDAGAPQAR